MKIFSIGFTQKSAEEFFGLLTRAGVKKVVDIRLHNTSQLAGFSKRDDLKYFLTAIGSIDYEEESLLCPTEDILRNYKKNRIDWDQYESRFRDLMRDRQIETNLSPDHFHGACLLCSEATPERCHRRLVAEYLQEHWGEVEILHLI